MTEHERAIFLETLWHYYDTYGRHILPWRRPKADGTFDPYEILVSEMMLQQTQVSRVLPKFAQFMERFPTVEMLAAAPLSAVLKTWQGLGYNRRAQYLWRTAKQITESGWPEDLVTLPGVGVNTAGAILAYAYNRPAIFVETNIRTVYIYHFAAESENVPDAFIRDCLRQTIDGERPREFYWALMDYGSYLKTKTRNLMQSAHHRRQTTFAGSRRQLRGQIIRELSAKALTADQLKNMVKDDRLTSVLEDLQREGLIRKTEGVFRLADV